MAHHIHNTYDFPHSTVGAIHQQNVYPRNVHARVPPVNAPRALPVNAAQVPPVIAAQVPLVTAVQVPIAIATHSDLDNDSEMWNMYLDEVKEDDSRITEAWKEDASSIITFTGLFSAVVGAFIIEFYRNLSPNSGDQTVALLQQISHQLPNSPNGAYSSAASKPSPPGTAMVWVNALWLISLVLSLTCALIATLLQQWARRYTETPKSTNMLRHRARVRSLLLTGTILYKIPLIVEILPTLLHLSVYLFLGGLVIAFHTINKKVAIAVDVAVGISGLAYVALSIVPCLDVKCPYRTPISKFLWYPCHALLSLTALCLHRCMLGPHRLLPVNPQVLSGGHRVLLRWLQSRGYSVSNHWLFATDGLEKSIHRRAVNALQSEDCERVGWLFHRLALGDKQKFLKFAASIPRYRIPVVIPPIGSPLFQDFGESLLVLLRSCVASRFTVGPNADVHERSLLVCLHAIRHIVKANAPTTGPTDLNFMRAHFANTGLMQSLWGDIGESIRMTSRSICALVAKQVIRKQPLDEADLNWLRDVTGESSNSIREANVTVLHQMNFKSFVKEALRNHVPHSDLSTEDNTTFNETLAILLGIRTHGHDYFTTPEWRTRLSEEVGQIQRHDRRGALEVFNALRLVFPSLPPVTSAQAELPPSHYIPPPSPVLHPTRAREVPPPRAPPSSRPLPPLLEVYPPGAVPPPPPLIVYPSGAALPPSPIVVHPQASHRAHRHNVPM